MNFNKTINQQLNRIIPIYHILHDEDILQRIFSGNNSEDALTYLLYGRYADMLKSITLKSSSVKIDFNDFIADLELKLIRDNYAKLKQLSGGNKFKSWLYKVAYNMLLNLVNGVEKSKLEYIDGITLIDYEYENEKMERTMDCIRECGDEDSKFVIFKEFEGYHPDEIAVLLTDRRHKAGTLAPDNTISTDYVYTLKSRLIKKVRSKMRPTVQSPVQPQTNSWLNVKGLQFSVFNDEFANSCMCLSGDIFDNTTRNRINRSRPSAKINHVGIVARIHDVLRKFMD